MGTKVILPLVCAFFVAVLEGLALYRGVDGKCLAISAAIIGGLGGYGIGKIKLTNLLLQLKDLIQIIKSGK